MQSVKQYVYVSNITIHGYSNLFRFEIHNVVHCEWDDWVIGKCSKSCGGGMQKQTRKVKHEAQFGGEDCPGKHTLEISGNVQECPCSIEECPGK